MQAAGLTEGKGLLVKVPRVAEARAALECVLQSIQRIGSNNLIIGEVVALHTAEGVVDERMHVHNFTPIARMGTPSWYARSTDRFELPRIKWGEEGAPARP
jgi:flavin reductase (DIM6/NTAB) family NADH-FMN oxidoreductase RutF